MEGATISLCSAPGTAGVEAAFGATALFSRCCGRAMAAVKQTEAINKKPALKATLLRIRINVLPAFSVEERQASGPSPKRHCTRDGADTDQKKNSRPLHPLPHWAGRA